MDIPGSDPKKKVIVFLVHGTRWWGLSRTRWLENGALVAALRTKPDDGIDIVPFRWKGWNTHRARVRAADRLAQDLEASLSGDLSLSHFVVAHSHGGNVAMYAVAGEGRPATLKLVRVVTLGTPFIYLDRRGFLGSTMGWILLHAMIFVAALAARSGQAGGTGVAIALLVLLLLSVRRLEVRRINPPSPSNLTIVRAPGDEASILLGSAQSALWLAKWVVLASVLAVLVAIPFSADSDSGTLFFVAGLTFIGATLLGVLGTCIQGFDGLWLLPSLSITMEPSPPGRYTVVQLPPERQSTFLGRLAHSRVYSRDDAVAVVKSLIIERSDDLGGDAE